MIQVSAVLWLLWEKLSKQGDKYVTERNINVVMCLLLLYSV